MTTVVTLARGSYLILHQLPTSSGRPAASLKMALRDLETSPVWLALTTANRNAIGHLMPHSSLVLGMTTWHGGL